jgi:diguanylate cyclase (GGDEF)-like protein
MIETTVWLAGEGKLDSCPDDHESALLRRAHRGMLRRRTLLFVIVSVCIDTVLLYCYALIGSVAMVAPLIYFAASFAASLIFFLLSESGIAERYKDHFLTSWQVLAASAIELGALLLFPEVGILFLLVMFVAFGFGALRLRARQALPVFFITMAALALAAYLHPVPVGIPSATAAERAVTMAAFMLTLGRCVVVGLYGGSLRQRLYHRGVQLRDALSRIETLAEVDPLTGLANRRTITKNLGDEIRRAVRSKSPSCVALIDIDMFKNINDKFGHPAGDEVLRTFGINIFANIRAIDKFGRFGGEEFLMILPETSTEAAAGLLNRLRGLIRTLDWSSISPNLDVTFSAGVVEVLPDDTVDSILARADAALYSAKHTGRNRVVTAKPRQIRPADEPSSPSLAPAE